MGVAALLRQFAFHTLDGGTEEERDEKLVGTLAAYLAQGIDVGGTVLDVDDEEGMAGMQEHPVGDIDGTPEADDAACRAGRWEKGV